jgi:hypothetical protein
MVIAETGQTTTRATPATHQLLRTRECIERMRVRVNAFHAHQDSLNRAALGISTIGDRLAPLVDIDVARHGWTRENGLAASALEATRQQLRLVLEADCTLPIDKQRACLNHALARATEAADLLSLER